MEKYILYGMIGLFFIGLLCMVLIIGSSSPAGEKQVQGIVKKAERNPLVYVFLAGLFTLFLVVTVVAQRQPNKHIQ